MTVKTGPRNLITDVAGIAVGNAENAEVKTGVTAVLCEEPATASVQVLGGAPGTRETDLLEPHNMVEKIDAVVLSGGSAFGLDAASGAQAALAEMGRGFEVGPHRVPIVPTAILFDLYNGGTKDWGRVPPYRDLGFDALGNAAKEFSLGSRGAGAGALTADLKGGLGSASTLVAECGVTVGALAAVNSLGSATVGDTAHFWAGPFEVDREFGGLGYPQPFPDNAADVRLKFRDAGTPAGQSNTTIAVIATDARLSKAECKRLAIAAHDGFTRAIWPSHTPADGDLVFAVATGHADMQGGADGFIRLCAAASRTMARAIARGVYEASPTDGDIMPVWSSRR